MQKPQALFHSIGETSAHALIAAHGPELAGKACHMSSVGRRHSTSLPLRELEAKLDVAVGMNAIWLPPRATWDMGPQTFLNGDRSSLCSRTINALHNTRETAIASNLIDLAM